MRLSPPTRDEISLAHHEAGHTVFAIVLDSPLPSKRVEIQHLGGDEWRGRHSYYQPQNVPGTLPDRATTPDHFWAKAAAMAWTKLVIGYAGPAATRRFCGDSLDPQGIRNDESATFGDEAGAQHLAGHFWPEQHRETILNGAAKLAGMLVQVPLVWDAVTALAGYLVQKHCVPVGEAETLIRRFLPVTIPTPETGFALELL